MVSERRTVLKVLTGCAGAVVGAIGVGTTGAFVAQSERRTSSSGGGANVWRRVARLDSLERATPVRAAVVGSEEDAWIKSPDRRIGAVWLVRTDERTVAAFSAVCPHLGCSIDHEGEQFVCKCHESHFRANGERVDGPSPRGMDALEARVLDGWVEVRHRRFKLGTHEKVEA